MTIARAAIWCSCLWLTMAVFAQQEKNVQPSRLITGTFDVKLTPENSSDPGRMLMDKQFHGDLEATAKGQMLTATKGSAGYVAIELVTGSLNGRKGTFHLQHSGTMNRGQQQLNITVVPDSGTGELTGLSGSMKIRIEAGGKHFYDFDYRLSGN